MKDRKLITMQVLTLILGVILFLLLFMPAPLPDNSALILSKKSAEQHRLRADSAAAKAILMEDSLRLSERQKQLAILAGKRAEERLNSQLEEAKRLLQDSLATVPQLKLELHRTVVLVEAFRDTVNYERLQREIKERQLTVKIDHLTLALVERTDERDDLQDQVDHLEEQAKCRWGIWFVKMPCMSRPQVAAVSSAVSVIATIFVLK